MFDNANELKETLSKVNELVTSYYEAHLKESDHTLPCSWTFSDNGIIISTMKKVDTVVSFEDILSATDDEYAMYLKLREKFEKTSKSAVTSVSKEDDEEKTPVKRDEMSITKKKSVSELLSTPTAKTSAKSPAKPKAEKPSKKEADEEPSVPTAPKKKTRASVKALFETDEAVIEEENAEKKTDEVKEETKAEPKELTSVSDLSRIDEILSFIRTTLKSYDDEFDVQMETEINDYHLSEMDRIEFFCQCEYQFEVAIDTESIKTIKDLVDQIIEQL